MIFVIRKYFTDIGEQTFSNSKNKSLKISSSLVDLIIANFIVNTKLNEKYSRTSSNGPI